MQNIINFLQITGITGDSVIFILLAIILLLSIKLMFYKKFEENNATFNRKFEENNATFNRKFEENNATFNRKFDAVDRKFDRINEKFEATITTISEIARELTSLVVVLKEKGLLKSQSPLQLSDEGEKISKKIQADVVFENNKKKLINYMRFPYTNDYDIQQDAFYHILQENFIKTLEQKELIKIKQVAFQESLSFSEILMVLKVFLRDYSIEYNKKLKKLENLLNELKAISPDTDGEIYVKSEFGKKISALEKKDREEMASILAKLEMKREATKVTSENYSPTVSPDVVENKSFPFSFLQKEYYDKAEEFYKFLIDTVKAN